MEFLLEKIAMSHADRITKIRLTLLFGIGMLALADALALALALAPLRGIVQIAVGGSTSCALTREGGVKCWGFTGPATGPMGFEPEEHATPVGIPGLDQGIAAIEAAGGSCALTRAGGVKCWGINNAGQLGDGTSIDRREPVDVIGLNAGVKAISLGANHACALTVDGGVKCWGSNYSGLGDGSQESTRLTPVDVSGLSGGVAAIASGGSQTCALTVDGRVECWGDNQFGQLGDGTQETRLTPVGVGGLGDGVAMITVGRWHACALTAAGGVMCWGANASGQLGDGTTGDDSNKMRLLPVSVAGLSAGVIAISAGGGTTCALTAERHVRCWGDNSSGQLGDGTQKQRLTPVDVIGLGGSVAEIATSGSHTCALMDGGGVKCWGQDGSGQLGSGNEHRRLTPVGVVGLDANIANIAAGPFHTCAATREGEGRCWGANGDGQLGDGTHELRLDPVEAGGLNRRIDMLAPGRRHTCALTRNKEVWCWGANTRGQLGDGTNKKHLKPVKVEGLNGGAIAITAGDEYNCALTEEGAVQCWGYNRHGQLGDGTTEKRRLAPVNTSGLSGGIAAVAAGYSHTCALTRPGGVKCWGTNRYGELGDGTTERRLTPVDVIGLTEGVEAIAVGYQHACALMGNGTVKCWGANETGQLGNGGGELGRVTENPIPVDVIDLPAGIIAITAGGGHTCALARGGAIKCWGSNYSGQLGDGTRASRVSPVDVADSDTAIRISAGATHTCALTRPGGAKCWGDNLSGQVGDGTSGIRLTPGDVMVDGD